jgi:hypothetical protein
MNQQKNIAFIICYFGKLPWYFNYFVHSCRFNSTVDFFIISDDKTWTGELPGNVKIINNTLEEISDLASIKLDTPVNITYGYKLCDFKPAYGLIFSDILKYYDFWGHCDIDIIFGNIRDFITDDILNEHDLISVRHDWLSGCFLLYKNNDKLNTLFKFSKDYKKVFCSDKHYCFDETNFAHDAFTEGRSYLDVETEIESMMHVAKKMEAAGYINPFFDFYIIEGLPGKLRWENGKMYYRDKFEILLYHLIYFKTRFMPKKAIGHIPDKFTITPSKIHHHKIAKTLINEL